MWNNSAFGDTTNAGYFGNTNQVDSPSKGKDQVRRLQTVVPVCIRQIHSCDDEFKLFGTPIHILTVVGILKNYEVQSTKATYELEDHTGRIKAIWWLENEAGSEPNLPLVKEGCYLRVYGSFRVQENQKILMVMKMFPVESVNEITNHFLEVIFTRLTAEANSKNSGSLSKIKNNNPGADLVNSMSFMNNDMDVDINRGGGGMGFTPMQDKVYRILQPVNTSQGLHRSAILQQFPANKHREVNDALEFLINEGHAYSTIDNDHFKATDSM